VGSSRLCSGAGERKEPLHRYEREERKEKKREKIKNYNLTCEPLY
jgi:hypothetical protein